MGPSSPSPWPSPFQGSSDFHLGSPYVDSRRDSDSSCSGKPWTRSGAAGGLRTIRSFDDIQLPDFYTFTEIEPPTDAVPDDQVALPPTPAPVARSHNPPARPGQFPHPPLLKALIRRSEAEVREALAAEPDAALYPFWEHAAEPPLCAAVRFKCPPSIVQVLIQHGADASVTDANGKSPLVLARRASIRDLGVEDLLQEQCGDASIAEDDANEEAQYIARTNADFPFRQFTWADFPETPGFDLPCAEGLPEPPCWARV